VPPSFTRRVIRRESLRNQFLSPRFNVKVKLIIQITI
jgi:hypothetical protein